MLLHLTLVSCDVAKPQLLAGGNYRARGKVADDHISTILMLRRRSNRHGCRAEQFNEKFSSSSIYLLPWVCKVIFIAAIKIMEFPSCISCGMIIPSPVAGRSVQSQHSDTNIL